MDSADNLLNELKEMADKLASDLKEIRNEFSDRNIFSSEDKVFERIMRVYEKADNILSSIADRTTAAPKSKAKKDSDSQKIVA